MNERKRSNSEEVKRSWSKSNTIALGAFCLTLLALVISDIKMQAQSTTQINMRLDSLESDSDRLTYRVDILAVTSSKMHEQGKIHIQKTPAYIDRLRATESRSTINKIEITNIKKGLRGKSNGINN